MKRISLKKLEDSKSIAGNTNTPDEKQKKTVETGKIKPMAYETVVFEEFYDIPSSFN